MTSTNPQDAERPRKRQRLQSSQPQSQSSTTTLNQDGEMADPILPKAFDDLASAVTQKVTSDSAFQPEREAQVGILHFVNAGSLGFTGTLKQRYVPGECIFIRGYHLNLCWSCGNFVFPLDFPTPLSNIEAPCMHLFFELIM